MINIKKIITAENMALLATVLGALFGWLWPQLVTSVGIFGDIFLTLLKSSILPLILSSIFVAVAKSTDHLAEVGLKTFLYFLMTSALACATGLTIAHFILRVPSQPVQFESAALEAGKQLQSTDFILSFFTNNFFSSLTQAQILPLIVFILIAGIASTRLRPTQHRLLLDFAEAVHDLMMILLRWILYVAPLGVFALVGQMVSKISEENFSLLGPFFLTIAMAATIHSLITLPILGAVFGKFSPFKFIYQIREALVVAFATASSSATLPVSTRILEGLGVRQKVTGFVLPLGATLNMNGSALYQALVVIFLGQIAGIDFSFAQTLLVFFMVMVSAAGTAGIPGGGLLMMTATLQALSIPLEFIGLYLLVDRFWDPPITMINAMDDLFAAKTIDRWVE